MSVHLQNEIDKLKKMLLGLSAIVEDNLHDAVCAVNNCDESLVEKICKKDHQIDTMEVEIEEECLKILALYQPVANDLRFIVAILKINNDLERIGDQVANIANKVKILIAGGKPMQTPDFIPMFSATQKMVKQSLDSLINLDVVLAREVCAMDDEVDDMKRNMREQLLASAKSNPEYVRSSFAFIRIAENLERIADLATNIAEDVIYMVEGSIVRHSLIAEL